MRRAAEGGERHGHPWWGGDGGTAAGLHTLCAPSHPDGSVLGAYKITAGTRVVLPLSPLLQSSLLYHNKKERRVKPRLERHCNVKGRADRADNFTGAGITMSLMCQHSYTCHRLLCGGRCGQCVGPLTRLPPSLRAPPRTSPPSHPQHLYLTLHVHASPWHPTTYAARFPLLPEWPSHGSGAAAGLVGFGAGPSGARARGPGARGARLAATARTGAG